MPNYKAEYTLEMILDLIEANLHQEGFELGNTPITFHLSEFGTETLILDIEKADRNAIPSFLNASDYAQDVRLELNAPAPTVEPAPAPAEPSEKKRKYVKPSGEKELVRRAKIGEAVKKRRAEERAAKAALVPVPIEEPETEPDPEPAPTPQAVLHDPADYLLPENKRFFKEPPAALLALHQQLLEPCLAQPSEKQEVVAPAAPTFPGARQ